MSYSIKYPVPVDVAIEDAVESVRKQVQRRTYLAANELRNSALLVLRGQRSGRRYKVPGTYRRQRDKTDGKMKRGRYYTASAPGEPPAVRTGAFRNSWQTDTKADGDLYISRIESDLKTDGGGYVLGEILEDGTPRMAPRPYVDRTLEKAEPQIFRIYSEPYD
jgi:hypothetical protein